LGILTVEDYFFLLGFCDNALPAAVLLALLVLPSRRTLEAADAALELVTFFSFPIKCLLLHIRKTISYLQVAGEEVYKSLSTYPHGLIGLVDSQI